MAHGDQEQHRPNRTDELRALPKSGKDLDRIARGSGERDAVVSDL